MTLVNVAIPVIRGRMLLTVDKGRPWSVIEHIILEALAEKAWITAELAVAGKLPRRIVIEACARLMRAGWAELLEDNRSVRFQATPRGRQVAQYEELPSVPERRRRTASYVIDLISNEIFRGRTWFVHDEQALKAREKTEPFVWIEAPSQEVDYDTTKLMELLLDDDETFVDAEPAGPLWRWAVVTVKDGVVDGFPPGRDLPVLRRAVLAAAATVTPETTGTEMTFSVSDAAVRRYADVPEVRAVSFDTTDLILGGKAHENAIKTSLAKARSKIFIHSTFIGDEQFLALLPNIADAVRRGVRVHVLWGQNEDAEGVASTKTAIAKLRQNKAVAELEPLLTIHPYSTRSHAKLILADAGKNGHYLAIIGSCNWFASRFLSYEMSVKLRDAVIVRDVAEYLARMSCMHGGVWSELATDLTSISQRLKKMRPRSTSNAHASLVIGAQHSHFVLRARDEAQHRVLVVSHKLGPVSSPSIVVPLMAAARQRGIEPRVFYGKTRRPMNRRAEAQLTAHAKEGGVTLNAVEEPRLHAKALAWDDDTIVVSSMNWLSADPTEIESVNEIGVWITAPGAAKTVCEDLDKALRVPHAN